MCVFFVLMTIFFFKEKGLNVHKNKFLNNVKNLLIAKLPKMCLLRVLPSHYQI